MSRILVVIPTYNELENIPRLIPQVLEQSEGIEVLVVDDGSPDGTGDIVRRMGEKDPRVHLLERSAKMGLGTAYVAGFRYALAGNYDFVFEMDADFSHNPNEIPAFLARAREADLVVGSRYTNGVRVLNWPMQRLLLSWTANVWTRFWTGLPLNDATGGFKCYRIEVLRGINLDSIRSNGYAFQIEMSYMAWRKGFRLGEIPIVFLDRLAGKSKMSKHIVYEAFFMLWKLRFRGMLNRL
ncbi:MAG TPA: polyprenol monophosphomannose synthase [Bacteroidota bacterium]